MSGFDKIIKGACKPKAAPPKSKYLDPILAATWSEDGAVGDVCKALSPKFKEPNAIVVFKALIVLHTMIRNGATDNVLAYLSSTDVLRLRNVGGGHWEGYAAPQNLQHYAIYLDSRIRAYRDTKHDAIRVQAETNRDHRLSQSIEDDASAHRTRSASIPIPSSSSSKRRGGGSGGLGGISEDGSDSGGGGNGGGKGVQRSKTMMGRKLRVMSVEKGLLRETKAVQKQVDALVEARFYLDDLEDELTVTALRMCVKDLIILFQAGNEGMVNVLEHFFEMSHTDAEQALSLYRHFCKQTERVVEYLGVAKKLQNLLSVPVPNMKHAPVSLAGALEEYLTDPNFEQNRIEYKTQKDAAEKNTKAGIKGIIKKPDASSLGKASTSTPTPKVTIPASASSSSSMDTTKAEPKQAIVDFFSAIEEEQQNMFNPQTGSPTSNYFQQQAAHNPFFQQQTMTGAFPIQQQTQPFGIPPQQQQPFGAPPPQQPSPFGAPPQLQIQQTGFIQPQQTAFQQQQSPTNPFGLQPPGGGAPSFLRPQAAAGFLQPQATGAANPFRQSMLMPQSTGSPFGLGSPQGQGQGQGSPQPFGAGGVGGFGPQPTGVGQPSQPSFNATAPSLSLSSSFSSATSGSSFSPSPSTAGSSSFTSPFAPKPTASAGNASSSNLPPRPGTAPIPHSGSGSGTPQPVKTHQTGSRNPFGPVVTPPPPVPQPPTMMELMMGGGRNDGGATNGQQPQQGGQSQNGFGGLNGFGGFGGDQGKADMSSIASSFSKVGESKTGFQPSSGFSSQPLLSQNTSTTSSGSTFSDSLFSSSLSSQPTGATVTSASGSISTSPTGPSGGLKPHMTGGFSGLKQFKPSSSFGATLLESLPPIPQSAPTTPGISEPNANLNGNSTQSPPPSTNGLGSGFGAQRTGALNAQPTGAFGVGLSPFSGVGGSGSTIGVGLRPQLTGAGGANPFRASMFTTTGSPGAGSPAFGGTGGSQFLGSTSTPAFGGSSMFSQPTGAGQGAAPSFGASLFGVGGSSFASSPGQQQQTQPQQHQNGFASLI
ncbi:hypothetical protein JAAARDRAFT_41495 [Jaapia argillacea MUCL 33604]|uniref:ENTH domain-containing protein n=1 Tax=Jaapia argillacea MUCL 33604 TaxID=933084 RepID=A0A067PJ37_9AGAM|nr:hypothetical protein JAAARDRAFT_41495 [Jaapia argillacea MUCL 33604]